MGIAGLAICLLLGAAALILLDDPPPAEQNEARQVSNTPAIQLGVSRTQVKDEQAKEQAPVETPGTEAMPAKVNQTPQTPDQESKPDRAGVESDSRKATAVSGRPPVEDQAQLRGLRLKKRRQRSSIGCHAPQQNPIGRIKLRRTGLRNGQAPQRDVAVMSKAKREERLTGARSKKTKAKTTIFSVPVRHKIKIYPLTRQQIVRVLGEGRH